MLKFSQYSGAGNSFYLFDNRLAHLTEDQCPSLAQHLCQRRRSDGLILLENSSRADYRMRIFNPDGSEAEMCGNGLRCLVQFLKDLNLITQCVSIQTMERILTAQHLGPTIEIEMGAAEILHWDVDEQPIRFHLLHTGVPHIVLIDPLEQIRDFIPYAKKMRHHPLSGAKGANVNLVRPLSTHTFSIRTFERGVEDETQACGTGVTAAALALAYTHKTAEPLTFITASGIPLIVRYEQSDPPFGKIHLEGPVKNLLHNCDLDALLLNFVENAQSRRIRLKGSCKIL